VVNWSCNCPICRLFVHPVLRRVSAPRAPPTSPLATEAPPEETTPPVNKFEALAEKAPLPPEGGEQQQIPPAESVTPQPQPQAVEASVTEEAASSKEKMEPQVVEVSIPQELIERIEQLEEEVGKLRSELTTVNESIKSILVETRELLAEATSPFNVLRMAQKPSSTGNGGKKEGNGGSKAKPPTKPSKFVSIARIALKLLNDFGREKAIEIMRGYAEIGVIDKSVGETIVKIVDFVDRTKRMGIPLEKQIPYLYALTRVLGIQDPELDELLLKELMRGEKSNE
jgi:hypothetical protein